MDTLIHYGGAIKSLGETSQGWRFGGWLVVFDTQDVSSMRDCFTKATDFDIQDGDRRSVYYHHGLDGTLKKARLGDCRLFVKDSGVWIEGEIKKRNDYLKAHAAQIALNIEKFGLSSGAPAHLVERKAVEGGHEVLLWPLAEASITPTPAEPLTGCVSLKSLAVTVPTDDIVVQDAEIRFLEQQAQLRCLGMSNLKLLQGQLAAAKEWDESKHPRDEDGKWSGGAVAMSPHIGGEEGDKDSLSYQEAIDRTNSERHKLVLNAIDWIHGQLGIAGAKLVNGAGMYQGSGENSIITRYPEDTPQEKVKQAAAMMGYTANQKQVMITTSDSNGPHATHILRIPEGKMDAAFEAAEAQVKGSNGKFQAYSLMPDKNNPKQGILIIAENEYTGGLANYAQRIQQSTGAKYDRQFGRTEFLGDSEDRNKAQEAYRDVIRSNTRRSKEDGRNERRSSTNNSGSGVRQDGVRASGQRHDSIDTWRERIRQADPERKGTGRKTLLDLATDSNNPLLHNAVKTLPALSPYDAMVKDAMVSFLQLQDSLRGGGLL